jgi:bacterial/archaeal transporter family-2 protein
MFEIVIIILLALVAGVAIGMQASIAGEMSSRVNAQTASFVVHFGGTILSGALIVLSGGNQIKNWPKLSWYMWGAGAFGVILYLILGQTIPRLGAATTLVFILVGQLGIGMLIDHLGLFGLPVRTMDSWRVASAILLIAGSYLMVK